MATPARRCAYTVTRRVFEGGAYTDHAFRAEAQRHDLEAATARSRCASPTASCSGAARWTTCSSRSDRAIGELDPEVIAALRLGAYQLLYMDGVADHAAVTESVDLAKEAGSRGHGLVNAVLRRTAREGAAVLAASASPRPTRPRCCTRIPIGSRRCGGSSSGPRRPAP